MTRVLTLVNGLSHGDANPQTVCGLWTVGGSQVLTVWQFQPLQDQRVGAGDDVLRLTQVVLQDLTLVLTKVPRLVRPRAAVTRREGEVAEGRNGKLGAAVGQMVGCADHSEGRWGERKKGQRHLLSYFIHFTSNKNSVRFRFKHMKDVFFFFPLGLMFLTYVRRCKDTTAQQRPAYVSTNC